MFEGVARDKNIVQYDTDHGEVRLSPDIIKNYLVSGSGSVTEQEVMMFLSLCKYQKLNPFLREAYLIKYSSQPATIITGKEVFTKRASKLKECAGWEAGVIVGCKDGIILNRVGTFVAQPETLLGGWAKVYRHDWKVPIENSVSISEYLRTNSDGRPTASWAKMPATMIRKVALVQALRETFPENFQGLYTPEEMPVEQSQLPSEPVNVPQEQPKVGVQQEDKKILSQEQVLKLEGVMAALAKAEAKPVQELASELLAAYGAKSLEELDAQNGQEFYKALKARIKEKDSGKAS